jgi:hypothetical protein
MPCVPTGCDTGTTFLCVLPAPLGTTHWPMLNPGSLLVALPYLDLASSSAAGAFARLSHLEPSSNVPNMRSK